MQSRGRDGDREGGREGRNRGSLSLPRENEEYGGGRKTFSFENEVKCSANALSRGAGAGLLPAEGLLLPRTERAN